MLFEKFKYLYRVKPSSGREIGKQINKDPTHKLAHRSVCVRKWSDRGNFEFPILISKIES